MGTRLYVSAIILVLAWQLWRGDRRSAPWEKFWIFAGAVVLVTVMTALYTAVGGIRAVIWTDFIQVGVLVAALGFSIFFLLGENPRRLGHRHRSTCRSRSFGTSPNRRRSPARGRGSRTC